MRDKIPQELNKRYFAEEKGIRFADLNFDYFRGNITTDAVTREACLVVDGKKMSMRDLERILAPMKGGMLKYGYPKKSYDYPAYRKTGKESKGDGITVHPIRTQPICRLGGTTGCPLPCISSQ